MTSARYNLLIKQGVDFVKTFSISANNLPRNLTGFTARSQIRRRLNDLTPLASFSCIIGGSNGQITLSLSNSITSSLPISTSLDLIPTSFYSLPSNKLPTPLFYWDLELVSPSNIVECPVLGYVMVIGEATK